MFCKNCGQQVDDNANVCPNCGTPLKDRPAAPISGERKSKMVAGLLGIFLGSLGIHNFYLGYTKKAIIQIVVTVVTCGIGSIWGFIEGILILCGQYITTDANGNPLAD